MNKKHILFDLSEARKALEELIGISIPVPNYDFGNYRATWSTCISTSTQHRTRVMRRRRPRASAQKKMFIAGGSFLLTCRYFLEDELSDLTMYLTSGWHSLRFNL